MTKDDQGEYIINRDYLDEYLDLNTARKVIDLMIGLNGLKSRTRRGRAFGGNRNP